MTEDRSEQFYVKYSALKNAKKMPDAATSGVQGGL
jgi:hypothetical protein